MELDAYQSEALATRQIPVVAESFDYVPLLGLAGEVGEVLSEYKKYLRDGRSHSRFHIRINEELGDILWYLAATADSFGLKLSDIALFNLRKCRERWPVIGIEQLPLGLVTNVLDSEYPEHESFPRKFSAQIEDIRVGNASVLRVYIDSVQIGEDLTDNSREGDGYRFHDVFHLACAACLGWSPVLRRNWKKKRRSDDLIDEVEDGGRAIVIEEAISVLVFEYATRHAMLEGVSSIDSKLIDTIKKTSSHLEVSVRSVAEWERMILMAYSVWRKVRLHGGGNVVLDLDNSSITFQEDPLS